jgi:hypothetical protein
VSVSRNLGVAADPSGIRRRRHGISEAKVPGS